MLEKGTYISNEVLNEGIIDNIGYKLGLKKKSRWQRFKDTIKNNKGKAVAAGLLGLGAAGALGYSNYNYHKLENRWHDNMAKAMLKNHNYTRHRDEYLYTNRKTGKTHAIQARSWNPFQGGLYRSPKDLKFKRS